MKGEGGWGEYGSLKVFEERVPGRRRSQADLLTADLGEGGSG